MRTRPPSSATTRRGDAAIVNLVEFWTGEQIHSVCPTTDSNGNSVYLTPSSDGRQAVLTVSRNGKVLAREFFVKVSDTTFEVSRHFGTSLFRLRGRDGIRMKGPTRMKTGIGIDARV